MLMLSYFHLGSKVPSPNPTPAAPVTASPAPTRPPPKPFAPLGNRKALVEKSGLVKHATNRKPKPVEKQKTETKGTSNR